MEPLLDLRGLSVELPTSAGTILPVRDVSFKVAPGESLGLVGESGSGKTMLALGLVGLLPPGARRSGAAWLADASGGGRTNLVSLGEAGLRAVRGREIGFVFQEPMTALNPVMRVGEQISEALRAHPSANESEGNGGKLGRAGIEIRTRVALERAHVPNPQLRARQYPHQLSGGLRQRAIIAMALAGGPRLLIADEPTTALDVTVQKGILELLARLRKELSLSLLFITHDLAVVAQVSDRLAVMYAGRIVEIGPTQEVLRHPYHPYTEALLRASPRLDGHGLTPIPGSVPALDSSPPGCAFAPRCAYTRAECVAEVPAMRMAAPHHQARCILVADASTTHTPAIGRPIPPR